MNNQIKLSNTLKGKHQVCIGKSDVNKQDYPCVSS